MSPRLARGLSRAGRGVMAMLLAASAPVDGQATHVLVVSGLGGESIYQDLFHAQGSSMLDAARDRWGLTGEQVRWLAEDPARAPDRIAARSTRENVEHEIQELAGRAGAADRVLILLIGHGSESGGESKLNLPGPDLTASDLGTWLVAFPTQTVAVINTTSASGGFLPAISSERRIVVTATRSARERNLTLFGGFFVDAFTEDGADADKDERVSLLEAFSYARAEVERFYSRENRLQTEHALLDDDGDGEGTMEPGLAGGDGRLAGQFFLAAERPAVAARAADDPELAALLEKKRELEDAVVELRAKKDDMDPAAYETQLEQLLVELATTSRAIRQREVEP